MSRATFLRLTITLIGLWLAYRSLDLTALTQLLSQADGWWVAAGFALINLSLVLRAGRWLVLLRGAGVHHLTFGRLVELYFVGNFFNAFLPSGFGGDAVRVVEVAQEIPADVATGSVFLDRFTGLLVLFMMGLVALPGRPAAFLPEWTLIITLVCVGGLVGGFVLLNPTLMGWLGRYLPRPVSPTGDGPVGKFMQAVLRCGWPAIAQALGLSLLFNLLLVAWWTSATYALHTPVSFLYNTLVIPILAIALMVPSIGGLGVRELLAASLFAGAGLEAHTAVAVCLLEFFMMRLSGLLGAPLYLRTIWGKKSS